MALGKRRKLEEESEIDLTPMLDVVFIMLIFFIVTASFVKESGLDVNKPPPSKTEPDNTKKKNITFRITSDDQIFLGGRLVDIKSVRANIERLRAENPEGKVIIQARPESSTEVFVLISDQAQEAEVGPADIILNFIQ